MKILNYPSSGSYQNVTFSRNRNGQYVRGRAIPVNPGSTFQAAVRARFALNAQNWRDLTSAQRAGWADLGDQISRNDSLGQSYNLTGFQTYLSVNNNRLAAGDTVLADAPALLPPDPLATLVATIGVASFSVAFTVTPLPANTRLFLSASPQRSAGRSFEGDFRLITVTAAAATSPSVITAAYTARFGVPVVGNRIFVSAQTYFAGFLAQPLLTSAVVA
jgi:hypothetical protein